MGGGGSCDSIITVLSAMHRSKRNRTSTSEPSGEPKDRGAERAGSGENSQSIFLKKEKKRGKLFVLSEKAKRHFFLFPSHLLSLSFVLLGKTFLYSSPPLQKTSVGLQ